MPNINLNNVATQTEVDSLDTRVTALEGQPFTGVNPVTTYADLPATGTSGILYLVTNDPNTTLNGYYTWDGATYVDAEFDDVYARVTDLDLISKEFFLNLSDKTKYTSGVRYSPAGMNVISDPLWIMSDYIPVEEGETYVISGKKPTSQGLGVFVNDGDTSGGYSFPFNDTVVTIPAGYHYLVVNITDDGDTSYNDTFQVEKGTVPTSYKPHVPDRYVYANKLEFEYFPKADLINASSKLNLIDTTKVNFIQRYSTGGVGFTTDYEGIAATDYIKVKEGEFYAVSGEIYVSPQGGLFDSNTNTSAIQNIEFVATTGGYFFYVPVGIGAEYAVINLRKLNDDPSETTLEGDVQMQFGQYVTSYEPFELENKILENLLPDSESINASSVNTIFNISQTNSKGADKFPKFFEHYFKRDVNLNVILSGDSITARDFHTEYFSAEEQTKRPPLMVSKNIGSAIYDKLTWLNTQYARFDRSSFFTESAATFVTVIANDTIGGGSSQGISQGTGTGGDEWYDIGDRPADTRIYTGTNLASVDFTVPSETYTFNWIYRTDLKGCENVTVAISGGNGLVQVYDVNTTSWVEANGYVFSMRHPGVSAHRINTKFQERLRFRTSDKYEGGSFDQRTGDKTISITKDATDSRFLYWGLEWSEEPYIVTVINAARGGESINTVLPALDDDVFDWIDLTPDSFSFVIQEIYLNQGQTTFNSSKSINDFLTEWDDFYYSSSNSYSFREQSKVGGVPWQKFESLIWNPNPNVEGGGISTSEPYMFIPWDNATDGMKTIMDNLNCYLYQYKFNFDEEGLTMCNITNVLLEEAKAKFGVEWYKAFIPSTVYGGSFFNDGVHPNNYGVKVITHWLNSYFDFKFI